ncbi:MAG: response regulator transcription factor [Burkholderiales bacterium]|nr:response regulator transcription factor [Burkholderiales bacterium]MBI3731583.1 response regulator transcription factor [Burkholderiales bacterium]
MKATALIAEDEPLLAANLQAELAQLWPGLRVLANVTHGTAALQQALALQPDLLFLDIHMPGMTGLEVAHALAEDWPDDGAAFPLIVFVTAYDQYAVQAFERAAFDYVLKPVQPQRLAHTCNRLQAALQQRARAVAMPAVAAAPDLIQQLRSLLDSNAGHPLTPTAATGQGTNQLVTQPATPLRMLQVQTGNTIVMVPVDEVIYLESADKYVRVMTASREHLIRISLRELQPQLDPQVFWQIHRGTVVRCDAIASAVREGNGKLMLNLHNHRDRLQVSRLYLHLFKGM